MLTKGAIGNLVNRYRAVLKKCNLINAFGSLAVASMLVMGGAGVASAADYGQIFTDTSTDKITLTEENINISVSGSMKEAVYAKSRDTQQPTNIVIGSDNSTVSIKTEGLGLRANNAASPYTLAKVTVKGDSLTLDGQGKGYSAVYIQGQVGPSHGNWNDAKNGNLTVDKRGSVTVNSKTTTIKGFAIAFFISGAGQVDVNGDKLVVDVSDSLAAVRGHSILNINSKVAQLKGDVVYAYSEGGGGNYPVDSSVNINLSGADSYWEGAAKVSWYANNSNTIPKESLEVTKLNVTLKDNAR